MPDLHLDEPLTRSQTYTVLIPTGGWRRVFTQQYIREIQPIAETLALMHHRPPSDYESYLQEADAVYRNEVATNSELSWIRQRRIMQEDPVCQELWNKLQMLLALKEDKNGNN